MKQIVILKNKYFQKTHALLARSIFDERGMTFIELIVVMSIFATIASIVLFRFDASNKKLSFTNLGQDIALVIVSAQKAAISGVDTGDFLTTAPSYGIYLNPQSTSNAASTQLIYFKDLNHDKLYSGTTSTCGSTGNECMSVTTLNGGYFSQVCRTGPACSTGDDVAVTFTRPFPDAALRVGTGTPEAIFAEITSTSGEHQTIVVTNLGQIRTYTGLASAYGVP